MPVDSASLGADVRPKLVALTGGIATGKSTCAMLFKSLLPETVLFDADQAVARLYSSPDFLSELTLYFGDQVMLTDGGVDKAFLRQHVFNVPEDRKFIERALHPRVVEECLALFSETSKKGASPLFVADIPLLFEGGFDLGQSADLLVATSRQTQISRLKNRNAWDDSIVEAVLQAQMPISSKLVLADVVFWNEGPLEVLHAQCKRYLRSLNIISEACPS